MLFVSYSGEVGKEGDDNKIEEETGLEGEQLIERLRKLNNALNIQLKKQREKIREQTIEKQGYVYNTHYWTGASKCS